MYVETSSLVAYYIPEQKSTVAQQVLHQGGTIQISQLTELEMRSALKKKVRMSEINKEKSKEAYLTFQEHTTQYAFQVFPVTDAVFKSAQFILQTTTKALRTLDALHLGITQEYGLELFSFDRLMVNTAKEFDIPTIDYSSG